ncbi:hypothetical protein CRH09_29535 [Nocardia terpenica]|uniref:Uncharacterized protein n=1 Tax=Nocardia terpenica TaxID=455432 RepID=A0A291RQ56_9NOCA|nr:hypothetical protein CRH09_29535 [Nocardia terpenica]
MLRTLPALEQFDGTISGLYHAPEQRQRGRFEVFSRDQLKIAAKIFDRQWPHVGCLRPREQRRRFVRSIEQNIDVRRLSA